MNGRLAAKDLFTGGHGVGGVTSFTEELGEGLVGLGILSRSLRVKQLLALARIAPTFGSEDS
jgi:hypothetical protein